MTELSRCLDQLEGLGPEESRLATYLDELALRLEMKVLLGILEQIEDE